MIYGYKPMHQIKMPPLSKQGKKVMALLSLLLFNAFFSAFLAAATLTSSVDRIAFPANETVVLTISYDEDPDGNEIDHTLLQQDFNIVSSNKSSSIQIINGSASRKTDWIFELAPRKKGLLLIPSFSINNHFSEAITITATDAAKNIVQGRQKIYSELDIDKKQVHVQEQLIVTFRLVSTLAISDPVMNPPQIDNVLVHDLGSRQYQRSGPDNTIEVVLEQRYAFFPQNSGSIDIPSQQFQFAVNTMRRFHTGLIHNSQERRIIRTDAQSVTVLPAVSGNSRFQNNSASNSTGQPWLPALSLTIDQELADLNAAGQAIAGEPFTRIITLRASGLMAEQLPSIPVETEGFKTYSDKPAFKNDNNENGVIGTHTERVTMIAEKAGTFTLPAIEMPWYNTVNQQWEMAQLPARDIIVLPGKATTNPPVPSPTAMSDSQTTSEKNASSSTPLDTVKRDQQTDEPFYNQISPVTLIIISALIIALLLVVAKLALMQKKMNALLTTGTLPTNDDHVSNSKTSDNTLMLAANSGDVSAFYKAVLQWARTHWNDNPPHTLADIVARIDDAKLREQLLALEACLFSDKAPPSFSDIAMALQRINRTDQPTVIEKPQLEELY